MVWGAQSEYSIIPSLSQSRWGGAHRNHFWGSRGARAPQPPPDPCLWTPHQTAGLTATGQGQTSYDDWSVMGHNIYSSIALSSDLHSPTHHRNLGWSTYPRRHWHIYPTTSSSATKLQSSFRAQPSPVSSLQSVRMWTLSYKLWTSLASRGLLEGEDACSPGIDEEVTITFLLVSAIAAKLT